MAEKTKNLGIRMSPDEHIRLRKLAVDLGRSVQGLVEDAVRATYFEKGAEVLRQPPPSPFGEITKEEARLLRAVLNYWREGPDSDPFKQALPFLIKMWGDPK